MRRIIVSLGLLVLMLVVVSLCVEAAGLKGEHQLAFEIEDGRLSVVTSEVLSYELRWGVLSLAVDIGKKISGEQWIQTELAFTRQIYVVDVTLGVNRRWVPIVSNKMFLLFAYPW